MDEEPGVGRREHSGVVVRVAGGDHAEVQRLQRLHRGTLLLGHAKPPAPHEAGLVDVEPVAQQRRTAERAHQRIGELVERVRQDEDLIARAQVVEEFACAGQRPHALDHALDVCEREAVLREQLDAKAHQPVVVGLVARRARQLGNARPARELDPDLGNENAFQIEANHLHRTAPTFPTPAGVARAPW